MSETITVNRYKKIDEEKLREFYKNHDMVDCAKEFKCCQETIRRRLIQYGIRIRTRKEAIDFFLKSEKAKPTLKKRSLTQKQKYKKLGKKMFSRRFIDNIGNSKNIKKEDNTGKNNSNWKGGISSSYWRQTVISEYGAKCDECGWNKIEEVLHAHHIDFNRKNNNINNGRVLCPNCHTILHFKERGFK